MANVSSIRSVNKKSKQEEFQKLFNEKPTNASIIEFLTEWKGDIEEKTKQLGVDQDDLQRCVDMAVEWQEEETKRLNSFRKAKNVVSLPAKEKRKYSSSSSTEERRGNIYMHISKSNGVSSGDLKKIVDDFSQLPQDLTFLQNKNKIKKTGHTRNARWHIV